MRDLLAGVAEQPHWSRRARQRVAVVRPEYPWVYPACCSLVFTHKGQVHWWTFAGGRANAALAHGLVEGLGCRVTWDNFAVRLEEELQVDRVAAAIRELRSAGPEVTAPAVDERALEGLKFAECLPPGQAAAVVQARLADPGGVAEVLRHPVRTIFETDS
jgi:ATP-dependent Lhr-like helicase